MKLRMLSLVLSSAALATSVNAAQSPVDFNIKLSNFGEDQVKHCLYTNVTSIEDHSLTCNGDAIVCSDSDEFVFNGRIDSQKKHFASIRIRNEETKEWIVDGSVRLSVDENGKIITESKSGLENVGSYQFDNNFEFFLNGETGVTMYDGENLTGESIKLFKDMPDLGDFNEKMNSVDIPKNWIVRFYEGKNYTGGYYSRGWTLTNQFFDEMDFEPRIQSMRIITVLTEVDSEE